MYPVYRGQCLRDSLRTLEEIADEVDVDLDRNHNQGDSEKRMKSSMKRDSRTRQEILTAIWSVQRRDATAQVL